MRHKGIGLIDTGLVWQFNEEIKYWHQVLERIVAVIKFLSARGLPFRGYDDIIGSVHNGNYLGTLELLSQFDPFLKEHMRKYDKSGKGSTSYLSANICEEFITLLGKKVLSAVVSKMLQSKYYSISVDCTPDVSHVDQLAFTVRYIKRCRLGHC